MGAKDKQKSARDRILETAADLFYRQGYQATGINEIIAKSGVAKASFYANFPSKDDLCKAYLERLHSMDIAVLEEMLASKKTPFERFMGPIESLEPWMKAVDFKGCGFLNIVPEITNPKSPLRKTGQAHYENLRAILRRVSAGLIGSDKKYRHLEPDKTGDAYLVIFSGAIAMTEIIHDTWPLRRAVEAVRELVDSPKSKK